MFAPTPQIASRKYRTPRRPVNDRSNRADPTPAGGSCAALSGLIIGASMRCLAKNARRPSRPPGSIPNPKSTRSHPAPPQYPIPRHARPRTATPGPTPPQATPRKSSRADLSAYPRPVHRRSTCRTHSAPENLAPTTRPISDFPPATRRPSEKNFARLHFPFINFLSVRHIALSHGNFDCRPHIHRTCAKNYRTCRFDAGDNRPMSHWSEHTPKDDATSLRTGRGCAACCRRRSPGKSSRAGPHFL